MGFFDRFTKPDIEKLEEKNDVEGLVKSLEYNNPLINVKAAKALVKFENPIHANRISKSIKEIRDPLAVPDLITFLKNDNPQIRNASIKSLGAIGDPTSVEPLFETLKEYPPDDSLITLLVKIDKNRSINYFIQTLNSSDDDKKEIAAKALGNIGDERAIDPLLKTLSGFGPKCRIQAMKSLVKLGDYKVIKPILENPYGDPVPEREISQKIYNISDPSAVPDLIIFLKYDNTKIRDASISALGEIGDPTSDEPLFEVLNEYPLTSALASVLVKIDDERALELLIEVLKRKNIFERRIAADTLGEIGDKRAIKPLIEILNDEWTNCRYAAIRSLVLIGDDKVIRPVMEQLKEEGYDVITITGEFLARSNPSITEEVQNIVVERYPYYYNYTGFNDEQSAHELAVMMQQLQRLEKISRDHTGLDEEIDDLIKQIDSLGVYLCKNGGFERMQRVFNLYLTKYRAVTNYRVWKNICSWLW
ncbi:HEAT repeat domain-containing protein [uncultured Methanobacterium sp.]|uniref:HEAT repeat domain-containing protein n=1 Tax=uncultured Methanobacterium sp. TaxID=176306 RepID=UPI002AA8DDEB|nr:HEAT repeat domain-containing protein [uncultured Methanobacterium sp.]